MRHMLKLAPSCVKLIAYQTLVPPKLEYTSSVRSPRQSYLADKFELVQNGALCFIFSDYTSPTRVLGLRVKAGIQSPTLCRQISRLTILNKIYCHNQGLKDTLLSSPAKIFQHIDNFCKVAPMFSTSISFDSSSIPLTIKEWNALPELFFSII